MPFPLPFVPREDYHPPLKARTMHGRFFGARREGGRRMHAGCDLIAPQGTEVLAIEDGTVYAVSTHFYHGTGCIALKHSAGYIARYCEVEPASIEGVKVGQKFRAGDIIAHVGKMYSSAMLHFELYDGTGTGELSVKTSQAPHKRRGDLLNPTLFLDRLRPYIRCSHGPISLAGCESSG